MSEFSDSYHLSTDSQSLGIELLRRSRLEGYVFAPSNGWVTVLPAGQAFSPNADLIAANDGVLLHYSYGDDHGWLFELYERHFLVVRYECTWEDDEVSFTPNFDIAAFESKVGKQLSSLGAEKLRGIFQPRDSMETLDTEPAHTFVQALGLTNANWSSFSYMSLDESRGHPLPPGLVHVR